MSCKLWSTVTIAKLGNRWCDVTTWNANFQLASEFVRIYAKLFETNISSKRVLEKAGFVQEGQFRKAIVKEGKVLDQLLYAKVI